MTPFEGGFGALLGNILFLGIHIHEKPQFNIYSAYHCESLLYYVGFYAHAR